MNRKVIVTTHLIAAIVAFLTIVSFFISSLVAEFSGDEALIVEVKRIIFYCLPLLFVVMPLLGISGNKLAGKSANPIIKRKMKRIKFILLNGLILTGLAIYLYVMANAGEIDGTFYALQVVELLAGATNLILLVLMFRDGFRLSGRTRKKQPLTKLGRRTAASLEARI
jgi:hypothetical protein